jgi:hypothetical protein
MRLPNIVFRGARGAGKRTKVQELLRDHATRLGQIYALTTKKWCLKAGDSEGGEISTTVEESSSSAAKDDRKGLTYEVSKVHRGFDVARMSLEDKKYVQAILSTLQGTPDILLGGDESANHIIVMYHAHLLSEESVILLQEALEVYNSTLTVIFTSEYPLPARLMDWFVDIPVAGSDRAYMSFRERASTGLLPEKGDAWVRFFQKTWDKWRGRRGECAWPLEYVIEIRKWIYVCRQRNLRWCDMIQYWLETAEANKEDLSCEEYREILRLLATAPTGGGFVMLPSYRIEIAWEEFMINFVEAICGRRPAAGTRC